MEECQEPIIDCEELARYHDNTGRPDRLSGGVTMVPVKTPAGEFRVWTKRIGNNPRARVLILHGGPGATHELYEAFDSFLPAAGIEYHYYDQLGSAYSDQPDDASLWDVDRFVDEVDQVRAALGLNRDNFILYGQSWGGILAIEYALRHQQHLKGLVISNMMASVPDYCAYARDVLAPQLPPEVYREVRAIEDAADFANPRYMELLMEHYYPVHVLRMPPEQWPEPVLRTFAHLNEAVYVPMQGQSEFGVTAGARLAHWDRKADLHRITVPTLTLGATHDTMDPGHMEWMARQFPNGTAHRCPNGSHLSLYDDQEDYFNALTGFIRRIA